VISIDTAVLAVGLLVVVLRLPGPEGLRRLVREAIDTSRAATRADLSELGTRVDANRTVLAKMEERQHAHHDRLVVLEKDYVSRMRPRAKA
jgi:hypothetical protein